MYMYTDRYYQSIAGYKLISSSSNVVFRIYCKCTGVIISV